MKVVKQTVRWVGLVSFGVLLVNSLPDVARYLRLREMSGPQGPGAT